MATIQETVCRLAIEATSRGVSETTAKVKQLGQAQEGVTVVSQRQERATQSLERRIESINRTYDRSYRVQQQLAKLERELNAGMAQGLVTAERKNFILAQAAAQHGQAAAASTAHARALGGLNAQMVLTRSNAAMMLGALAPGRMAGVGAMALTGGPAGALVAGITAATAAAAYFWQTNQDGASKAETALREHDRLLGVVKQAYSGAAGEAEKFHAVTKEIALLQARQSALALRGQMGAAADSIIGSHTRSTFSLTDMSGLGVPDGTPMAMRATAEVTRQYRDFAEAIRNLQATAAAGEPDIAGFRQRVAEIGLAAEGSNPALAAQAAQMLKNTEAAGTLAHNLRQAEAAIRMLEGRGTKEDRDFLGITTPKATATAARANEYERTTLSIQRQVEQMKIEAETYSMTARAVAEYRIVKQLETAAIASKIEIGKKELAAMSATARAYGDMLARIEGLREAQARAAAVNDMFQGVFVGVVREIANGANAMDAITNSLIRLADQLLQMAAQDLWRAAFPQSGGGFLGALFGGLGGGVGNPTGYAVNPWSSAGIFGMAGGGPVSGPGTGKSDSILARVSNGEFIVNAEATSRHFDLLKAINANALPTFALGGAAIAPGGKGGEPVKFREQKTDDRDDDLRATGGCVFVLRRDSV